MSKPFLITLFLFIAQFNLNAIENRTAGARSTALSQAYVSVSDIWSSFHNQAGLAKLSRLSGGVFYESRFSINQLSLSVGVVAIPTKTGTFGLNFYQFGKGSFKEHKIGLAFAKQLSQKILAAVQLDYLSQRFPENNRSKGFATFEAGIIYQPNNEIFMGVHAFNPIAGGIETFNGKQIVPPVYRIGGHYQFDEMVMVIFEAQKVSKAPLLIKTGIEFSPVESLFLRFGVSGKPANLTAGIGYKVKKVSTDIGFSYHGNLGLTPSVSLHFEL